MYIEKQNLHIYVSIYKKTSRVSETDKVHRRPNPVSLDEK